MTSGCCKIGNAFLFEEEQRNYSKYGKLGPAKIFMMRWGLCCNALKTLKKVQYFSISWLGQATGHSFLVWITKKSERICTEGHHQLTFMKLEY